MVRNNTNHQPIRAGYRNAHAAGWSLVTTRSKALKAFSKEVMWITYAQVSYLSPVVKSANLSISLATYYSLTRYNRAFITKEPTK